MIQPQDKREAERVQVTLPATYMDRVKEHAKELNDSSPEYVIAAIVQDYFAAGRDKETGGSTKPKAERSTRPKEAAKAVAIHRKGKEATAA